MNLNVWSFVRLAILLFRKVAFVQAAEWPDDTRLLSKTRFLRGRWRRHGQEEDLPASNVRNGKDSSPRRTKFIRIWNYILRKKVALWSQTLEGVTESQSIVGNRNYRPSKTNYTQGYREATSASQPNITTKIRESTCISFDITDFEIIHLTSICFLKIL